MAKHTGIKATDYSWTLKDLKISILSNSIKNKCNIFKELNNKLKNYIEEQINLKKN